MGMPDDVRQRQEEHARSRMSAGIDTGMEEMTDDELSLAIVVYAVSRRPSSTAYLCLIEAARRLRKTPWLDPPPEKDNGCLSE